MNRDKALKFKQFKVSVSRSQSQWNEPNWNHHREIDSITKEVKNYPTPQKAKTSNPQAEGESMKVKSGGNSVEVRRMIDPKFSTDKQNKTCR